MDPITVYIGTYTQGRNEAIYVLELDRETGRLEQKSVVGEGANPTFLALHPNQRFLYAANETDDFDGDKSGSVSAFAIEPGSGSLTFLNRQSSRGSGPCHVSLDTAGSHVLVANYGSGSVAVLPVGADGRLAPASAFQQHRGTGPDPGRQEAPHAHSIQTDPSGKFVLAADLGLDRILVYRFDPVVGTIKANDPPFASLKPGAGPRHAAFHPNGRDFYVINELDSTVTGFRYDARAGALQEFQTLSTLPAGFSGESYTAEIQIHPSGKFLYGSNRGHDTITYFSVDGETGRLQLRGHEPTQGRTPRNFTIDLAGEFLLAANQGSDSVVVFRIDMETGQPVPTGNSITIPTPVCVKYLARA